MTELKKYGLSIESGIITFVHHCEVSGGYVSDYAGELHIPKKVKNISRQALIGCNPEKITVEKGNKKFYAVNDCLISGDTLIMGCDSSVIPADGTVTKIGDMAFNYAVELEFAPVIPDTIKEIGYRAFAFASENEVEFIVPASVELIKVMAFAVCAHRGVSIRFEGDPVLEAGVFGTKAEAADSDHAVYRALPNALYTKPENICVIAKAGGNVAQYCKRYGISCRPQ